MSQDSSTTPAGQALLDLCPTPQMAQAWLDGLIWAAGERALVAAFEEDTGFPWTPSTWQPSIFAAEHSVAGGLQREFIFRFATWFNEEIWGDGSEEVDQSSPKRRWRRVLVAEKDWALAAEVKEEA